MAGLFISYSNEKARHDTGKNLYVFASFECFILFFAVLILRCGTFHVRFECGGQLHELSLKLYGHVISIKYENLVLFVSVHSKQTITLLKRLQE